MITESNAQKYCSKCGMPRPIKHCVDCGGEMLVKSNAQKYCSKCGKDRKKMQAEKAQKKWRAAHPEVMARRYREWVAKNPGKERIKKQKARERERRLIQLARASIELMPSLKELL